MRRLLLTASIASALVLCSCGEKKVMLIRHEHIEPQSPMAFHIFSRACKVMYRIGAAIELKRMGYKFEEIPCKI